jgi:hypothetical protein
MCVEVVIMPHDVKAIGKREEIINWLSQNVGEFKINNHFWSAQGEGWELLPYGVDYNPGVFQEPNRYIIRIWSKDMAFLAKLRWE